MSPYTDGTASQAVYDADAARFDKAFREAGAIFTIEDEGELLQFINPRRVPGELVSAYRAFTSYGYANGLIPVTPCP